MKKVLVVIILASIISCKKNNKGDVEVDKKQKVEVEQKIVSLIEHPYIFEEADFQIEKFTAEELIESEKFLFSLTVSGNIEKFENDHRVFVHGFNNINTKEFLVNFVMNKTKKEGNKLIFYKEFSPEHTSVELLRFGITDIKEKKRLFVLTLKDIFFY